ncbi:hypothetical protein PIB30_091440 [Stylosanthes scabra]|uniref:Uncharacterized protein n=1 Tax=Stylosanthes scabra TaxID=79078 RepID=A0ABU6WVU7_9FABA|nr:hypothetical protein [Stylosanthes scabra]
MVCFPLYLSTACSSPGKGFMSFCAYQGRKLFDSFEESIQEFKWHYFKVLPLPVKRPFWLDDEEDEGGGRGGSSLDPSVVQGSDDCFRRLGLRPGCASLYSGYFGSSSASKVSGKPTNAAAAKPFSVEKEEGVREDPAADLRQKRRKQNVSKASAEEAALGGESSWKHKVNPIDRAFPPDYNFRAALDAGLTNGPIQEILGPLVPEQLLGTAQFLACQLTACLQVCAFDDYFFITLQEKPPIATLLKRTKKGPKAYRQQLATLLKLLARFLKDDGCRRGGCSIVMLFSVAIDLHFSPRFKVW